MYIKIYRRRFDLYKAIIRALQTSSKRLINISKRQLLELEQTSELVTKYWNVKIRLKTQVKNQYLKLIFMKIFTQFILT